jgi:hypothetical protein
MNKLMTFCLLLALAAPVFAVDDGQVMYAGGTVPGLPAGAVGRLDTTSEESLTFEYSGVVRIFDRSDSPPGSHARHRGRTDQETPAPPLFPHFLSQR